MKINFKKCVSITLSVLALAGAGSVKAIPVIAEQILSDNGLSGGPGLDGIGGFSVAILGEWGFVGSPADETENGQAFCKVYVYRYDYLTNLWGDGGGGGAIVAGAPYSVLGPGGSCSTAGSAAFGFSVSTSTNLLAIGAPLAKFGGSSQPGKIFFFRYIPGFDIWALFGDVGQPLLSPGVPDLAADGSAFGTKVSIRLNAAGTEGILIAGAPLYDGAGGGINRLR